ncbi:MAG TPA: 50S ribosomal protein L16, partial [Bacteroidia bacterium]
MLQPKKTTFRKMHKMVPSGNARRGTTLAFGSFGLKATETAWVTARQIEAARVALTRHIGRDAKVWIRIFPDKPITKKP